MKSALRLVCGCLLLWSIMAYNAAFAWDGERKGFVMGFGAGPSISPQLLTVANPGDYFLLATDFKIGYAPTQQLELSYPGRAEW